MTPEINSKLPNIGTTIFTRMSVLAAEFNAINLGQGFPDFDMSRELIDLVSKAMQDGRNQYTHMNGLINLREVIAEKVSFLYNSLVNPETEITITPGGTYAIYTALTATLRPGDEVIVFEPAYDSYIPNIEINGALPVLIPLTFPDYKIDWELVKNSITPKTRMVILNSPHNPTGSILGKEDMLQLSEIVKGTRIIILSDEVYEHLIFDNKDHQSILRYPALLERSFVCFSFGKVFHCTGWKMGYCISPASLMNEFRKVHQFNAFSTFSPAQFSLSVYMQNREHYLSLGRFIQQKRDSFELLMKETRLRPLPSYGSYFQLYDYSAISEEPEIDFAMRLTKEYGVATIPVSAFYKTSTDNSVLRFCFVKKQETLESAVNKLIKL